MNFYELREKINNYQKFKLAKRINKSSVINRAYPGQFNLSFTESKWLDKFEDYLDVDGDFFFSMIQPVIRYNDFKNKILVNESIHKYLGLFDMADLVGAGVFMDKRFGPEFTELEIKEFIKFFSDLGISLDRVYVSCFSGASVVEATGGKYKFEKFVPPFEMGKNFWIENGLSPQNIISDKSRDTFLALNLSGRPTPWGYRNEIYIKSLAGELIDVATLEHLIWRPVFKNGEIVDICDYEHFDGLNVVGIERLCMVINNFENISQCEHINPLVLYLLKASKNYSYHSAFIVVESLRVVHRIISDIGVVSVLSKTRRCKLNDYLEALWVHLKILDLSDTKGVLKDLLKLNSELNYFYPELKNSADSVFDVINEYFERRF